MNLPPPADVPHLLVPVSWILVFALSGMITLLVVAWGGFSWLQRVIRHQFRDELYSEEFRTRLRELLYPLILEQRRIQEAQKDQQTMLEEQRGMLGRLQLEHAQNHRG